MKPAPAGLTGIAVPAFVSLGLPDGVLGVAWPSMRGALGLGMAELGFAFAPIYPLLVAITPSGSVTAP